MSTTQHGSERRSWTDASGNHYVDSGGAGWILFSGTILVLLAAMNAIYGIAAVNNSKAFVGDAQFVLSGLNTWGWVLIAVSLAQLVTGFGIWFQWSWARWAGVAFASINALVQLLIMPAFPLWSLCLFALDVFVIYGLVVHGAKRGLA